jgi:hypothetical protein
MIKYNCVGRMPETNKQRLRRLLLNTLLLLALFIHIIKGLIKGADAMTVYDFMFMLSIFILAVIAFSTTKK